MSIVDNKSIYFPHRVAVDRSTPNVTFTWLIVTQPALFFPHLSVMRLEQWLPATPAGGLPPVPVLQRNVTRLPCLE